MKGLHEQLLSAREPEELLRVSREYIASLTPEQWAALPPNCRPDRIRGTDDLQYWRERLTENVLDLAKEGAGNDVLREMLVFFTAAAERVSALPAERRSVQRSQGG
jgi:hypothetical protein